jgi:ribokinase
MSVLVVGGIFREILNGDIHPTARMGGSGLTASIIAARLGAQVALTSYVGSEDANTVTAMLEAAGVDHSSLITLPGASGTFVFPADEEGRTRPWPMYRPAESLPSNVPNIRESRVVLVFGIPDFDPIASGWLDSLSSDSILIWDQQGWISRARDSNGAAALPPRSKTYLANLHEARDEFPAASPEETLNRLPPAGFNVAIIKRGAHGCSVVRTDDTERIDIPGFSVPVRSTIGSGDAFAGALAASLRTVDLISAAHTANATAAAFLACGGDPLHLTLLDQQQDLLARSPKS